MKIKINKNYYNLISFLLIVGLAISTANLFLFDKNKSANAQIDYTNNNSSMLNREIKDINNGISDKKSEINKLQDRKKELSQKINDKQEEKANLNNQLALLDNRVEKSQLDIEIVDADISRINLEIQKTNLEIKDKNAQIEAEKEHIANILGIIHKRDNATTLEILLLNDSLADFLSQSKYLEDINEEVEDSLEEFKKYKRQLIRESEVLDQQKQELGDLQAKLAEQKKEFENEKESKTIILNQVASSEREYQRLLAQAKKEQENAAAEIASMEKLVRAKISKLEGEKLAFNDNGFVWPVKKNVITAYFHDPDYPFRYIFEHPAIDIRAGQGSALKASASGYVARTKRGLDGGYGYIMLIHGDGFSTVYGHVSKIFVSEDEYVVQGQPIGQSGGLPGTPGAGRLTTGPHLHFEVRLNGIPVDPLAYLP
ncbi:MAG: peptidoglycan DD-metalloendopeptidase family protein [Patescibacteria group bacterium]|nr:peptidoglycan DD-metalloendopeptidase family protein [Patescibacteria group bacterium]